MFESMRYAHTDGYAVAKFSAKGHHLVTGGADGDIRIFEALSSWSESNSFLAGDEVLALACDLDGEDRRIFVAASNTNTVMKYNSSDKFESSVVAVRFTADSTCIDVSSEFICAGSADMTVKVVRKKSFEEMSFEGHEAPVLSVAISPCQEYFVSSSCDGTVRLWNIVEKNEVKTFKNLWKATSDFETVRRSVAWNPTKSKKEFSIPVKDSIKLITIEKSGTFSEERLTVPTDMEDAEEFSTCCWSSDGRIAGATTSGRVFIWSSFDKRLVFTGKSPRGNEICSMDWHPKKSEIVIIDNTGHWGMITNLGDAPQAPVHNQVKKPQVQATVQNQAKKPPVQDHVDEDDEMLDDDELAKALFEDDDDDDNENSFSIRKIKKETGFDNDGRLSPTSTIVSEVSKFEAPTMDTETIPRSRTPVFEPDIQAPFQPGSTPEHLESRFMKWNSVGIVKATNEDSGNSIDIEFHDVSVHHTIHMSNANGYTMADLSAEALVLAREAQSDDDDAPSMLMCHHFASSDLNKEWSVAMPKDEEILAVCCGTGWVAVATDRRNLRLFTVGGLQREVISLPGPIVALAGKDSNIAVAIHKGMPLPRNQFIGIAVFNMTQSRQKIEHPLPTYETIPMAPRSSLAWLGFTDEQTPCIMDSAGYIRILNKNFGVSWSQVCDTKAHTKGKKDHHFLVGVSEKEFTARTIYVKGSHYPSTIPRPTMTMVPLGVPLAGDLNAEKTLTELDYWKHELILRSHFAGGDEDDQIKSSAESKQNESLLKMFALASRSDHDTRALEICRLMADSTLQLSIKYASKLGRMQLANRISQLAINRQEEEEAAAAAAAEEADAQRFSSRRPPSADLFASQRDIDDDFDDDVSKENKRVNPILEAKKRKLDSSLNYLTPTNEESKSVPRNPFKKACTSNVTPNSAIRTGIVFDEMSKRQDVAKQDRNSFGARKLETPETKSNLFGFQLYLSQNEDALRKELGGKADQNSIMNAGRKKWSEMSREDKNKYKAPKA